MESYRVYKSLSLEDFMDDVTFIVAKIGMYAIPIVQNINYLRKVKNESDDYWKRYFVEVIQKDILTNESKLDRNITISELERCYLFVPSSSETQRYIAIATTEEYQWYGFGTTEETAKQALVSQYNEFYNDNRTVEGFERIYGCKIDTAIWIDGAGYMTERY